MRYLLFFLIGIFFFSCKKQTGDYEISGLLVDASSASGLKFAEIEVYETLAGATQAVLISTVVTDKEGHYSLKVKRDRFDYLTFKVNKENYFAVQKTLYFSELTLKETNVFNIATSAKAWAKIHFVSNNSSNTLSIIKGQGKKDCAECCLDGYQHFSGAFDTTFYCINDGNSQYLFTYFINGGTINGVKSGITPSFDTLSFELNF